MSDRAQGTLFDDTPLKGRSKTTCTFVDNLKLPVHRWFRYSAGFSAEWVRELLRREKSQGRHHVLDPFSGAGTVLLECEECEVAGQGIENHPFIARIAKAKLLWREDSVEFTRYALAILKRARKDVQEHVHYPPLIEKCFSPESLLRLDALRRSWHTVADGAPYSELAWLALVSILRACSHVGTAQWQYVLPNKSKACVAEPFEAFEGKIHLMAADMKHRQRSVRGLAAVQHIEDARSFSSVAEGWADLVITSPPYANNYDYADATRLEMTFTREIDGWGDLQDAVRQRLVRSCTQHAADLSDSAFQIPESPLLEVIRGDLLRVCRELYRERAHHGGKKPYHAMIAAYFLDLASVWRCLRRACSDGANVCFVIGDSAPYGIHVPVEVWLGELALSAGFREYHFEKIRDRNIKWKNRKHSVPLKEGHLWARA